MQNGFQILTGKTVYMKQVLMIMALSMQFMLLAAKKLPKTYWLNRTNNQKTALIPNSPGSTLEGFALCGSDGKWFWANAKIEGNDVIVSSPKVATPVKVRYAYQNNPTCNLFNGAGLPAGAFALDVK